MVKRYRALVGMNYPGGADGAEVRVEEGEEAIGVPAQSLPDLLAQGYLEEIPNDAKPAKRLAAPAVEG